MKKVYTAPLATEVNVEASHMLAASLKLDNNKDVDTTTGQLSNSHRGEVGNLWKEQKLRGSFHTDEPLIFCYSTTPTAIGHAQCGVVTPRGLLLMG